MRSDLENNMPDVKPLNRLIRSLRVYSGKGLKRPSDQEVAAYVAGTATSRQKAKMIKAMAVSAEFRQEILDICKDVDALSALTDVPEVTESIKEVPTREEFLKAHQGKVRRASGFPEFKTIVSRIIRLPVYIPVAAAAVIALMTVRHFSSTTQIGTAMWRVELVSTDPSLLISNKTRGLPALDARVYFATSRDAALAAFSELYRFDEGKFVPVSDELQIIQWTGVEKRTLIFANQADSVLFDREFSAPAKAKSVQVWRLGLPERDLYSAEISKGVTKVLQTQVTHRQFGFAIVAKTDSGFTVMDVWNWKQEE